MTTDKGNTMTATTVTIAGREYTLHLNDIRETSHSTIFKVTGKRGADGTIFICKNNGYEGRATAIGISALEKLNWWDISRAIAPFFPECAKAVA